MRLTLRNLLAYMDGNLRPEDSEDLGKRIEESKVATDLYHKIRDVVRRIRLGAPSVSDRSANADCNTVAEYLDNQLPAERVVEFEEACLKSDMHLAEVAASHQILTLVQVEPAEIAPDSRQRMYQLPKVAQQAEEERQAVAEVASLLSGNSVARPVDTKSRPKPVVPEYLREPAQKPRLLFMAACVFIASASIGLVLMAFRQFDADKPIPQALAWAQAKLTGGKPPSGNPSNDSPNSANKAGANSSSAGNQTAGSVLPGADSSAPAVAATGVSSSAASVPNMAASSEAKVGATAGAKDSATSNPTSTAPDKATVGEPTTVAKESGSRKPVHGDNHAEPAASAPPALLDSASQVASAGGPMKALGGANPAAPDAAETAPRVGRFMSDGQDVLLKLESATQIWRRVLPEEFLSAGQSFIALPGYRPRVVLLNVGATLEMLSGTRLDLTAQNAQGQPGANIDYGRVVLKPLAQAGPTVRISAGGHSGTLTLSNVESVVGIEVARIHSPGANPEKVLSHSQTTLFVAKGSVVWSEGEGKPPAKLTAPMAWPLDMSTTQNVDGRGNMPDWVLNNTINDLDQRAALVVSQALPADRPAPLVLRELTDHPRIENRWLAVRCLGHLGRFEPMVAALNDASYRREWSDYIDQLREAISRGPETAAAVRAALESKFGNDAPALYRMLWGYTNEDLSNEEDARLVKALDDETLVFRVLAFANLKEITGQGFYYRPEQTPAIRAKGVLRFRQQQVAGKIRYKMPEDKANASPAVESVKPNVAKGDAGTAGAEPAGELPASSSSGPSSTGPAGAAPVPIAPPSTDAPGSANVDTDDPGKPAVPGTSQP